MTANAYDRSAEEQFKASLSDPILGKERRRIILADFHQKYPGNRQCVATPYRIVEEMCSVLDHTAHNNYVVFHAFEFIEHLYCLGIPGENMVYIGDTEQECQIVENIYGATSLVFDYANFGTNFDHMEAILDSMPAQFNIVIGNPPYQEPTVGDAAIAKPIYHLFIQKILETIDPEFFSFIIPAKWFSGGVSLNTFRQQMMQDKCIQEIRYYPSSKDVFANVAIGGGVCWFVRNKEYNGQCKFNGEYRSLDRYDIIVSSNKAMPIIDKVLSKKMRMMNDVIYPGGYFGDHRIFTFVENGSPCYFRDKQIKYISGFKDPRGIVSKWKVFIPHVSGNYNAMQLNEWVRPCRGINPFIASPGEVSDNTYTVLSAFDSKQEAENFHRFMTTKFVKFLIGVYVSTPNFSKKDFCFVPDMKDYTKSWTDQELYKFFDLSQEEINFIESRIKDYQEEIYAERLALPIAKENVAIAPPEDPLRAKLRAILEGK